MKKAIILTILLLFGAGYVFLQTTAPSSAPPLASIMPGGALVYLESPHFDRLLREWDTSQVKAAWLSSANYEAFARSNLSIKLQEVYDQYATAAGLTPTLRSVVDIAGPEAALALYEIREVQFLYVTRVPENVLVKSELWALRDKFQQRQAGGTTFYLRNDPTSKRTVAFAFAKGHFLLATREDLVAEALQLLAGGTNPSIAADRWYREATNAASGAAASELRLVMNLDSLVKSTYFRSYWIQRNTSAIRRYWTGITDLHRAADALTEHRHFLRAPDASAPTEAAVGSLLSFVPPDAGFFRAWTPDTPGAAPALIVEKLIAPTPLHTNDYRVAPWAVSPDLRAGSEADLEARIDEQPLKNDANPQLPSLGAVNAVLLVQSSAPAGGPFIQTPTVVVLQSPTDWNAAAIRAALSDSAGHLWSTAQLGAAWTTATAGSHAVHRLTGLATLFATTRGQFLFAANDAALLASVLDRVATAPTVPALVTYGAGFRHLRERPNFDRMMQALDFGARNQANGPPFFSGNVASLSTVLSGISEVQVTRTEAPASTGETVVYRFAR
jgi:hypothetical protein